MIWQNNGLKFEHDIDKGNAFMAIRIKARSGETAEQMLRRFKKLCEKEGLTKDIKKRAYFEKPSERKQRALRKAQKRTAPSARGGRR